ncbi:MAG: hypothetical protein M1401_14825 [Chloroflexi bacterium]|nr:hypothetical protein [Chloroflexota bacterium]MCL5110103.1 hypothetical protein [Chloroflexota bacterium]
MLLSSRRQLRRRARAQSQVRDGKLGEAVLGFLKENAVFLLIIAALAGGYLLLRQGPSSVASAGDFDAVLASGKPVLLEFYADT